MHTLTIVAALLGAGALATLGGTRIIAWMYPPRGRFIDVDGVRQHVVEMGVTGDADAPPIVLVHGAGCNLEDMKLALAARLAARYRLILIDRPGHGWSKREGENGSAPAYQAAMLRGILDGLNVKRVVLVGHSWGGALATAFTLDYPERVAGLVLLAPPLYPRMRRMTWLYTALATPFVGWILAHTLMLLIGTLLIGLGFWGAFLPQRPPRRYIHRAATLLSLRPATFLANAQDVAHLKTFLKPQAARYASLTIPTVVMTGDSDTIVSARDHAVAFAAAVPGAKLTVLPGIGHMPHHVATDRVVAAIDGLMSDIARPAVAAT